MEAILQGWLTKSPPEKKQFKLFGSKWRKRYFVLYAPPTVDGIPDARTAILEYYSSKKLHNKCGTINLSDCEEVLSSLDSDIFEHVFGLRTMHKSHLRTYYLAAATEVEMNKWVNRLCQVLGLTENDDGLSPPLHLPSRPGLHLKPLHMTQPMGIPGSTRQTTFQSRPLTHQPHPNFGPLSSSSSSGLLSPAPPPLRPVPSTQAADPFSRLNISEPNLLDAAKGYAENRRDAMDDGQRITSPPFSSRLTSPPAAPSSSALKSAGSFPELDRFSPTTRKPGHLLAGEGREFMELPPIPPEKTGPKVCVVVEPMRDAAYDLPKQKYYERSDGEEKETTRRNRATNDDDWYNSPPSRYNNNINNGQPLDNSFYNSPPSRYNSAQPPKSDCCNVLPPDRYRSMGGDCGLGGVSQEGILVDGHEWYNTPQKNSSSSEMAFHASSVKTEEMKMRDATDVAPPPLKPKRFTQDNEDCYNVPRPSANGGRAKWNDEEAGDGGWWDVAQNVRQHDDDSEDCYNVPKSQQDKRKHVSQGQELYNIAKSQSGVSLSSSNLPRQKSDRRSYGGRGCVAAVDGYDRNSRYRSSYGPSEDDYDMPKQRGIATRRPESGHGDLGLYNIPGLSMPVSNATDDDDDDFYSRPKTGRETTTTTEKRQRPSFNGDRPSEKVVVVVLPPKTAHRLNEEARDGPRQPVANWLDGVDYGNDDPYNLIPPFVSSNQPTFPASSSSHPSADHHHQQQTNVNVDVSNFSPSDSKLPSVTGDKLQAQETRVEVDGGENAKSTELKKTPSGAYKQNKAAVQSSTSLHKKQAVQAAAAAAGGLPLHDSIRFTQRTKSFKRSIPSQDRSTLPLPVKRIVERSESSSSSSSDDESDQNNSTHSAKQR